MSTVAKLVGIRSGPSGAELGAAANAAKAQRDAIAAEQASADRVLAGQQKVASGGAGFLSFLDDDMKKLFGG